MDLGGHEIWAAVFSTFILVLFLLAGAFRRPAAAAEPQWKASWITHPTAPLREPLVLHFRRSLQLDSKPARYVVHVSADNRFILYVNGHRVGDGPASGDLAHWRYETFDLADYLRERDTIVTDTVSCSWRSEYLRQDIAGISPRMALSRTYGG
jgi:alpha-L-rhamnosidase